MLMNLLFFLLHISTRELYFWQKNEYAQLKSMEQEYQQATNMTLRKRKVIEYTRTGIQYQIV